MATLEQRLKDFSDAVSLQCKDLASDIADVITNIGDLTDLTTEDKTSLVAALNGLQTMVTALEAGSGAIINDSSSASTTETWSITKISTQIAAAVSALVASSPSALDTLNELAAALGDDANFAATTATALGNRVRTDTAAQGLDPTQQSNGRTNIGAVAASALGDTDADLASYFNAAMAG